MTTRATDWQIERATILHRICTGVEKRLQRRRGVRRAVRVAASRWRNRHYRCDPSRPVRISRKYLVDLFYVWKRNGKTREAFTLHYRSGRSKIPVRLVAEFIRVAVQPGVVSLSSAYRKLTSLWRGGELNRPFKYRRCTDFPFAYSTLRRALTNEQRRAIIELQNAEHAVTCAREKFQRFFPDD